MLIRKNKTYEGYTPRLIVTSEFIEREKFKLLSQEEILKYFEETRPDDMFGFSLEVLDDYLPTEYMKENFIDVENIAEFEEYRANLKELTIEDTVQDMLDYLVFGWTKIEDHINPIFTKFSVNDFAIPSIFMEYNRGILINGEDIIKTLKG